jgi:hypothetical protein
VLRHPTQRPGLVLRRAARIFEVAVRSRQARPGPRAGDSRRSGHGLDLHVSAATRAALLERGARPCNGLRAWPRASRRGPSVGCLSRRAPACQCVCEHANVQPRGGDPGQ